MHMILWCKYICDTSPLNNKINYHTLITLARRYNPSLSEKNCINLMDLNARFLSNIPPSFKSIVLPFYSVFNFLNPFLFQFQCYL